MLDLYTANLDQVSFNEIEEFLGMSSPIDLRPTEGVLLDFKVLDSGDWVDSVTSFANTAGGILFLGVEGDKTKNNAPIGLPGILFAGGDIKARLTSTLVSRVLPRPDFELAAVPLPTDPSRFIVIVRVREGQYPPYSWSKSGNRSRFPIRVEDTTRDATLRDLETLFQKRSAFGETTEARIQGFFATQLFPQYQEDYESPQKVENGPKPFHTWSIRPRVPLRIRLDRAFHDMVTKLVRRHYADSDLGYFWPPSMSGGSHLIRWQSSISPTSGRAPARWARLFEFTADGDLRYSERLDRREEDGGESISDAFTGGRRYLQLAEEFYRTQNAFGSMSVLHEFRLPPGFKFLLTFPDEQEQWQTTNAIVFSPVQRADGEIGISNSTTELGSLAPERSVEIVCEFMLAHLRSLRQASIDFEKLLSVVAKCPIDKPLIYFP